MPKNKNPLNKEDKIPPRVEPDLESDQYGSEEQDKIVKMVIDDASADRAVMTDWVTKQQRSMRHYNSERPSLLENLTKKGWQSDRNLGMSAATCDSYQATIFATAWNPDSIYYMPTEKNDFDNRDNLTRFTKWAVGPQEGDVEPEIDDYIHNKITQGVGFFKIYWKVWYEWVDKRIPRKRMFITVGYDIKTEKRRFEKGVIENIATLEDILLPRYGKKIQELPHMIHVLHMYGDDIMDAGKRGVFKNVSENFVTKMKGMVLDQRRKELDEIKARELGIEDVFDDDLRSMPCDLFEWYGWYTKNGRREKYRFVVDPITETFFSGKPLRKIRRDGKYPFVGGSLIREPGYIKGKSLPLYIEQPINALNNTYNQKADFQYVENCPFGFYKPDEDYTQQTYDLEPGVMFPVDDPQAINIPNFSRSQAWAESDIRLFMEILEKMTGAASYFASNNRQTSTTATRDMLVNEKSETRFGLWVGRTQSEIAEAITMFIQLYQEWAPPKLGTRVLGEDGKQLFKNLSIDTLRGKYDARMNPDIASGSKTLERNARVMLDERISQSPWMDPRINPRGSYNWISDMMKIHGMANTDRYLPPEPPPTPGTGQEVKDEWTQFIQGDEVELREGEDPAEHYAGHMKQKQEKYHELDEEYRPNFDAHLFATMQQFQKFQQDQMAEMMAERMAVAMVRNRDTGGPNEIERSPGPGGQAQPADGGAGRIDTSNAERRVPPLPANSQGA